MFRKIAFVLSVCLAIAGASAAQTKKPAAKPKPKTSAAKPKVVKPASPASSAAEPTTCYPLKKIKDYYKIDIRDEQFKNDFDEIFELSPYDYSGYSVKTILENRVRTKLGVDAANSLDLFAGASYVEISFLKQEYKKQIMDEICGLFADHAAFEKYIKSLKKKDKSNDASNWRK
ncbi:MAG: hypothetical protein JNL72_03435 [Flavipsychrobacter sp.]|nr:hypothetical protein [Flavipsychrobacter sp.]